MTHVKFLEGFSKLESFCKGFKSNYNPGRAVLAVDSLTIKKSVGESAINTVRPRRIMTISLTNASSCLLPYRH
jgi:hypothetical protein